MTICLRRQVEHSRNESMFGESNEPAAVDGRQDSSFKRKNSLTLTQADVKNVYASFTGQGKSDKIFIILTKSNKIIRLQTNLMEILNEIQLSRKEQLKFVGFYGPKKRYTFVGVIDSHEVLYFNFYDENQNTSCRKKYPNKIESPNLCCLIQIQDKPLYLRLNLENPNYQSFDLTTQILNPMKTKKEYSNCIYDTVGSKFKLYTDFIIHDGNIYLSHESFVSIFPLNRQTEKKDKHCSTNQNRSTGIINYNFNDCISKLFLQGGKVFAINRKSEVFLIEKLLKDQKVAFQAILLKRPANLTNLRFKELHVDYTRKYDNSVIISDNGQGQAFMWVSHQGNALEVRQYTLNKYLKRCFDPQNQLNEKVIFKYLFFEQLNENEKKRKVLIFKQTKINLEIQVSFIQTSFSEIDLSPVYNSKDYSITENSEFLIIDNDTVMIYNGTEFLALCIMEVKQESGKMELNAEVEEQEEFQESQVGYKINIQKRFAQFECSSLIYIDKYLYYRQKENLFLEDFSRLEEKNENIICNLTLGLKVPDEKINPLNPQRTRTGSNLSSMKKTSSNLSMSLALKGCQSGEQNKVEQISKEVTPHIEIEFKFLKLNQQIAVFNGLNKLFIFPSLHSQKIEVATSKILVTYLNDQYLLVVEESGQVSCWDTYRSCQLGSVKLKKETFQYDDYKCKFLFYNFSYLKDIIGPE